MRVKKLQKQLTEDNLSDTVADVFQCFPNMLNQFVGRFGSPSKVGLPISIYCRSRMSSIFPSSNLAEPLGNRCPDILCLLEHSIILIESKKGARFTDNQLEDYYKALEQVKGNREAQYFLLAPKSSIYKDYPNIFRIVTWDDVFDLFRQEPQLGTYSDQLETFRMEQYKSILDTVVSHLSDSFVGQPQQFSKNKYHGYHIQLRYSSSMLFAFSIYLSAPRYAKLFPFWLLNRATKMTQSSHSFVQQYRQQLQALPETMHYLEKQCPGYVIDLFPSPENTIDIMVVEVRSLINNECRRMSEIYESIAPKSS